MLWRKKRPLISVVVAFFNMRREAKRTLHSLLATYQKGVSPADYEVIVVDSASTEPLDADWVEGLQSNFRYLYVNSPWPTPNRAMNEGIGMARSSRVMCMIDGARILSPGVLINTLSAFQAFPDAYVHTLAFHLGHKLQNLAMIEDGYDQNAEDVLLRQQDWRADGYTLFNIACLAGSSSGGYLGALSESNCFAVSKALLSGMGGFDERFRSLGGGLVNLDLHRRLMGMNCLRPVMLLGEGSFHQFHGGVATNSRQNAERFALFEQEYIRLRGERFCTPSSENTLYFGRIHPFSRRFLLDSAKK